DGATHVLAGTAAIASYLHDFEGRFLQSIKTFLPSTAFTHTEIRRKTWKLEGLIAVLLTKIRESVEREVSGKLTHVVLGRPAVIASSGLYVGGDRFDAAIVEHRLLSLFGAASTYSTLFKRTELPHWMTRKLLAWNELSMLREKSNLDFLRNAVKTSDRPRELQN